ncbi:LysR family transcriptional regulator [Oceanibacterium hippocampi]|uniref:Hca operon transcriptional activator n=1 Tax=Oceanibacterium hippocampi TaxID=745714 RepID=A0A1Y5SV57_9PROT|nr:LysR family transcriptional regulator [Oceanibacterium hippocampi]SLN47753.1 Hca operon transcriptional activator [Oceanibacterium hippocampi]
MDTELARTFLSVVASGNFSNAANGLNVTQSTVSARIHALEELLGCRLFVRNKAGTTLTHAGRQFQKHASILVRTVEQARHDIGVARGFQATLTVGGRFGLWDHLLLNWLPLMRERAPDVSVRAEVGFEAELMQGLVEGRIDIGVMYTPQSRPGLTVEPLLEETLVLAATPEGERGGMGPGYVFIDWGPEFYARHSVLFPDHPGPAIAANIGWLGLQHILSAGGSGYFPLRVVRGLLAEGTLVRVAGAPEFALLAYMVYPADPGSDIIAAAIGAMRDVAGAEGGRRTD